MGFTNTTHNRTIHIDLYKPTGETIYLIGQGDDFAPTCSNESVSEDIYNKIWDSLRFPG